MMFPLLSIGDRWLPIHTSLICIYKYIHTHTHKRKEGIKGSTLVQGSRMAMDNTRAAAALCLSLLFFFSHVSGSHGCGACKPHLPPEIPVVPTKPPPRKYFPPKEPPVNPFCPRDALKLGACADLLGLAGLVVGTPPGKGECCELLGGLAAAEAAACLCTVVKESALGIVTEWSVAVSALVSACKTHIPAGYKCV